MPIRRFWVYDRMVNRLRAERDLRQVQILAGMTSQEGFERLHDRLTEQMGEVMVLAPTSHTIELNANEPDPELDRTGLESLRANIMRHGR